MTIISKPVLLSFNISSSIYLSKLLPLDRTIKSWKDLSDYRKKYPLPYNLEQATTFSPWGFLIITQSVIDPIQGWILVHSEKWRNSSKRNRELIIKSALNNHIFKNKRITKIGNDWSYFQEDIKEENGIVSTIHYCLSAKYVAIGDTDAISYDFVRKVRSALSINDELNNGIFPHREDTRSDVMVTINSGNKEFSSGLLMNIDESFNLNMKFKGSEDTIREYDEKNGILYTDYDSENTCIVHVKQGKNTWPYAASRVFRVLRIEDWVGKLKNSMKNLLRLKPTVFESYLKKGIRLLRGFEFAGQLIRFEFNNETDWDVKQAKVSDICLLPNSSTNSKLLFNEKWNHHLKDHTKLSRKKLPLLQVIYCMHEDDHWALSELKRYSDSVLSLLPEWEYEESEKIILLKGKNQTEIKYSINNEVQNIPEFPGEQLVISALRPTRPNIDIYTCLKRQLTEKNLIHQNYLIYANNKFNAPYRKSTHEINICQLLLKFGRLPVPFSIKLGEIDMTIGVDIGRSGANRSRPSMAVSIDRNGKMWGGSVSSEPQPGEEMSNRTIRDLLDNQILRYKNNNHTLPNRILILRDGNSSKQELGDMNEICNEWNSLGVDVSWITVQKSGTPRLLNYKEGLVVNILPVAESYLVTSKSSGWCWTTGGSVGRFPGIPRGFSFRVERNFTTDSLNIEQWSRILIAQAKTSQINTYTNTRLPFTIHLADKMAKALIRGSIPPDYSGNGFPAC